ncbi:MAG: DEAD/DEAH box helicase family protein [Acidobacteria bacterium]|nr:DEAD/DEAH box helicase family protein [Acidobacteriota bacterium]
MRLIIGAELEPDEHDAVMKGYSDRAALQDALYRNFQAVLTEVNDRLFVKRLEALQWLIKHDHLDIKVAVRRRGMYHEKIGVLEDSSGDFVVFQGSANESLYALSPDFNYESINVFRSWREGDDEYFAAHVESFRTLWSGQSASTLVVDFPEASRRQLLSRKFVQVGSSFTELEMDYGSSGDPTRVDRPELFVPVSFEVFEHQRISLEKWQKKDGIGILDLATGAGKTFTALYAATKFLKVNQRLFLVIAVPYQVLAEQWEEELAMFGAKAIMCSSRNANWEQDLAIKVDAFRTERTNFVPVICVNATLATDRFQSLVARIRDSGSFLFVGDECHHHGTIRYNRALPENADMRLGLSATYERHGDPEGTARLESYYGSIANTFSLADAIEKGFLVPYRYNLVLVELSSSESDLYEQIAQKIKERFRALRGTGTTSPLEDDVIKALLLKRSRFLGTLSSKRAKLEALVSQGHVTPRTLIYCGEGKAQIDDDADADIDSADLQNIDLITRMISTKGFRVSRFTSREAPDERREILSMFRTGNIEVLTAIRCLDEGVNIPACETAFILASSTNPRQFIQRRGRILRRSPGKLSATLWDFLPLPPRSSVSDEHEKQILRKELGRISEFSRHSMNFRETYQLLTPLLQRYDLGADFLLGADDKDAFAGDDPNSDK